VLASQLQNRSARAQIQARGDALSATVEGAALMIFFISSKKDLSDAAARRMIASVVSHPVPYIIVTLGRCVIAPVVIRHCLNLPTMELTDKIIFDILHRVLTPFISVPPTVGPATPEHATGTVIPKKMMLKIHMDTDNPDIITTTTKIICCCVSTILDNQIHDELIQPYGCRLFVQHAESGAQQRELVAASGACAHASPNWPPPRASQISWSASPTR
jgi:hypothetical protein